ncbi:DVU3141 family protein [Salinicola sp. CPA57]|uniref:DVU3141 family protein n=1 Tax=Salinicola sp. CPA57 TaxID=1949080 RepID=UPI0013009C71|nr:DVU3141 family protein [Salinicola sp. CPA57]
MKKEICKFRGGNRASRWLAVALMLTAASGCATSSQQRLDTAVAPMNEATPVNGPLSTFLDSAATGSVATLATSPWGANVSVHARERYFSASGRRCVRLDVTRNAAPAGLPVGEVTCLVPGKGWYAQRLVTEIIR